jgi:hypothetical protein
MAVFVCPDKRSRPRSFLVTAESCAASLRLGRVRRMLEAVLLLPVLAAWILFYRWSPDPP